MDSIKSLQVDILPETFPNRMSAVEITDDLKATLNPGNFCVKGSELMQILVGYAEPTIEPVGWQALWRCDFRTSQSLKNRLASPAVVEVTNVDYERLEATVELLDDNSHRTEIVSLIELHPLTEQENSAINIESTNKALQRIRFFLHHLFYPWDTDIQESWFDVHLPVRVQMFCELRSGMLNQEIVARYHYLLTEAFEVERRLQGFAEKVPDSEDEMDVETVENISNLNSKLEQIQQDVEILLNPSTRMLLFGSKVTRMKSNDTPEVLLVIQGQDCMSIHQILNDLEKELGSDVSIRCYPSLQTALDDSRIDDIIAIPKGIHSLLGINSLRFGGSLIGIGNREDVVLHLGCSEVGLQFDEGSVSLKNCTILVNNKQSGISVKGNLTMDNCILRGVSRVDEAIIENEIVSSWKGLYLASHSSVNLKNCVVSNFDVGIRARISSRVSALGVEISDCNIGFLVEENSIIGLKGCEIKGCKEFAVVIEMGTETKDGATRTGGPELITTQVIAGFQETPLM